MYKVGIDIGGTKINTGLFDAAEKKLGCNIKDDFYECNDRTCYGIKKEAFITAL